LFILNVTHLLLDTWSAVYTYDTCAACVKNKLIYIIGVVKVQ